MTIPIYTSPFQDQNSRNGGFVRWENHRTNWSGFQHAMFDYRKVYEIAMGEINSSTVLVCFNGKWLKDMAVDAKNSTCQNHNARPQGQQGQDYGIRTATNEELR